MNQAHLLALALLLGLPSCTGRALTGLPGDGAPPRPGDGGVPDRSPRPDHAPPSANSWITVQPGSFMMGSPPQEPCRLPNEEQHPVKLTRPYAIGATEVTQAAFRHVMGYNPSAFPDCGEDCPVDSVDWNAAVVYCNRLSEQAGLQKCYSCVGDGVKYSFPFDCDIRAEYRGDLGKTIQDCPGYRLPTEAEWERAYRAGTTSALFNGAIGACFHDATAASIAWYSHNAAGQPHRVAQRKANPWGLYDMAGNLWEWVNDWYHPELGASPAIDPTGPASGSGKVLRGGAWVASAGSVRAASRNQNQRFKALGFVGFRCTRTLSP